MYITPLKTILVEALKETFDGSFPLPEFRETHVDPDYPVDEQNYPAIWVDYDDTQPLLKAGISHRETVSSTGTTVFPFTRWRFQGYISLTVIALNSLERDRLFDQMVRVVAFGEEDSVVGRFRYYISNNDLIAANLQTDKIEVRGNAAAPGTPWGTDEMMYERSLNLEIIGEFVPDPETGTLVPLSAIIVTMHEELPGDDFEDPITGTGPTDWH
jgi:hypothetical protein